MTNARIAELRDKIGGHITVPVRKTDLRELLDAAESANALAAANERLIAERDEALRDRGELVRLIRVVDDEDTNQEDELARKRLTDAWRDVHEHILGNGWTDTPEPVIAQVVRERDALADEVQKLRAKQPLPRC